MKWALHIPLIMLASGHAFAQYTVGDELPPLPGYNTEGAPVYAGYNAARWSTAPPVRPFSPVPMLAAAPTPNTVSLLDGRQTQQAEDLESPMNHPHNPDQSAMWLVHGATAHITNPHFVKKGNSTDLELSRRNGLNAAIRASGGSVLTLKAGLVSTTGTGSAALYLTGRKTMLLLKGTALRTWLDDSPGLVVDAQAQARAEYLGISTQGSGSPALRINGTGSSVLAFDTVLLTEGPQSPAVLCDAGLSLNGARIEARMSPALVLEPESGASLTRATLGGSGPATIVLRSAEEDGADGPSLRLHLVDCTLQQAPGVPLFLVSNVQADIVLTRLTAGQRGTRLLQVSAYTWGTAGYNGGDMFLRANAAQLLGDMEVDGLSRAEVILGQGSTWEGRFTGGGRTGISLEVGSTWRPGGPCSVSSIDFGGRSPEEGVQSIQQEDGADVIYDPRATPSLERRSYPLQGGGKLTPME